MRGIRACERGHAVPYPKPSRNGATAMINGQLYTCEVRGVLDGPAIRSTRGRCPTERDGCTVALDVETKTRGRAGVVWICLPLRLSSTFSSARLRYARDHCVPVKYSNFCIARPNTQRRCTAFLFCSMPRWGPIVARTRLERMGRPGNNAAQQCPQMGSRFHGQLVPVQ
ncbi:hypothetical protein B0H16DRAFT_1559053 [Mycena metata]|uniref:Uncharacterized protein n=1 Tax=Mycena metata TaxID=1033252 RepID=A0AAD7N5E0_9AGAR|nr:hypothetical protein B0H16DRAFT_1559053 [Mycena metata]